MGLWAKMVEIGDKERARQQEVKDAQATRIDDLNSRGVAYCPRCYSTSVTPIKKGFGFGKALIGTTLVPGVGLFAGALGKNKIEMHCSKCGNKYTTGGK